MAKPNPITQKTNIRVQKVHGTSVETYSMGSARFLHQNNLQRVRYFEETFLLANISIKIILGRPFLSFSNANIKFVE